MNDDLFLQQLSVKDFLNSCTWDGKQKTNIVLATDPLQFWQLASVKDFFLTHNWNGVANLAALNHHCLAFSLVLNVVDFWQCFNWSGTTTSISSSDLDNFQPKPELIFSQKTLSVTDLSQLF
jgi:hypothetical protein